MDRGRRRGTDDRSGPDGAASSRRASGSPTTGPASTASPPSRASAPSPASSPRRSDDRRASEVRLTCAGRTDTGVHARAQVVHVDLARAMLDRRYGRRRRRRAPRARPVALAASSARRSSSGGRSSPRRASTPAARRPSRRYRYDIDSTARARSRSGARPRGRRRARSTSRRCGSGADPLIGEHDFAAFCRRPNGADGPITPPGHRGALAELDEGHLRFEIEATAFCHQMVRSIVGTLVAVGRGRMPARATSSRCCAAATATARPTLAPARGCASSRSRYPDELGGTWSLNGGPRLPSRHRPFALASVSSLATPASRPATRVERRARRIARMPRASKGIGCAHLLPKAERDRPVPGTSSTPRASSSVASRPRSPGCCAASTSRSSPRTSTPATTSSSSTPPRSCMTANKADAEDGLPPQRLPGRAPPDELRRAARRPSPRSSSAAPSAACCRRARSAARCSPSSRSTPDPTIPHAAQMPDAARHRRRARRAS